MNALSNESSVMANFVIFYIDTEGHERRLKAASGQSLMQVAVENDVAGIAATCGGCATCGTCHVYIADEWLDRLAPMTEDEDAILSFEDNYQKNSRLACQIRLSDAFDGIVFRVANTDV